MKKIISILICIQIALFPAFAFASANVGGWSMGNPVAQGASTVYTGTKNVIINGADYIKKGTAKITPPASGVAKVLARGVAGYALSIAVEQLLGSVDWVLDPANNQIKYTDPQAVNPPNIPKAWCYQDANGYKCFQSSTAAKSYFKSFYPQFPADYIWEQKSATHWYLVIREKEDSTHGGASVSFLYINNPFYDPAAEKPEQKTLPLSVVAQQVISNAQGGDVNAQVATMAAAADIVDEASKDDAKAPPIVNQLNNSASTSPANSDANANANIGSGSVANPNTADPDAPPLDITLKFPIFCNWAPSVCEAAQVVISFPQTLTNWWNTATTSITEAWAAVKEWATAEPDLKEDPTDLPIEEQTIDRDPSSFDTDYIVLGAQCPTFEPYTVSVGPVSETLSFDLMPLCQFAEKVRPAILGMSYLTAAGIVIAAIRET
ncbi:virulence factor TspB C-terminal domain-related protein [Acinetobacter sp. YH12086]|uniref:virulence factor TspB C-terminal domain-related protein n=1 Tax=Acinetobacter sp. YH12086 TaxID=2601078 RepID=UPI0015D4565F|nr:virulence factor TspB C-terminal domain-related protein [Acinetobacter sp. YH12086]